MNRDVPLGIPLASMGFFTRSRPAQYASQKNMVVARRVGISRNDPARFLGQTYFVECPSINVATRLRKKKEDERKVKCVPRFVSAACYEDGSHGSYGPGEKGRNFSEEAPLGEGYSPGVLEVVSLPLLSSLFFFSLFLSLSHFVILRVCMCVRACTFGSLSSHSSSPSYTSVLFSSSHFFGVPSLWLQLSPSHFYWTRWRNQPHHPSLSPFFLSFAYPAPLSPFFLPCPSLLFATWQSSSW